MTRDDTDEPTGESTTSATTTDSGERSRDRPSVATQTRRRFLLASAGVGLGALALNASGPASAATVEEVCNSDDYGSIDVADGFTLVDNQWGNSNADQCVWLNDDGSYGYDFDAAGGSGINYPEVICGTKPWGTDTGVAEFPIRRRDVDELVIDVEAEYSESGGEWDWAEEWWLMDQPPSQETGTHQYEIMLLLDWNDQHSHGAVEAENVWTDRFGNTVDHWTTYNSGGTNATFYIFRIQSGHDGGRIDLTEIVDYLTAEHGVDESLWLSGVELGNEYWEGSSGETTYNTFDVTINGSTYESGSGTDTPTPTETPTETETETDTETETPTDTETETETDTETETETPSGDALVVNDYDGDPAWSSNRNDLGKWCGAGSFQNGTAGGGAVEDGALVLEYDNAGWFVEQVQQDVSDYSTVVLRVSGANGGEESEFLFDMGGARDLLANLTDDSITTSVTDVAIDMDAAGIDPSGGGLSIRLNFWQGGASTLEIEEIRLE